MRAQGAKEGTCSCPWDMSEAINLFSLPAPLWQVTSNNPAAMQGVCHVWGLQASCGIQGRKKSWCKPAGALLSMPQRAPISGGSSRG